MRERRGVSIFNWVKLFVCMCQWDKLKFSLVSIVSQIPSSTACTILCVHDVYASETERGVKI